MLKSKLSFFSKRIQKELFPILEEELNEPLLSCHNKVAVTLEVLQIERVLPHTTLFERGRPAKHRVAIARAFIAKHVLSFPSTEHLIHRLKCDKHLRYICGWKPGQKIPSESTFSRLFAYLSQTNALERLHELLVKDVYENHIVLHCARDSVPIAVRERENKRICKTRNERYSQKGKNNEKLTVCEYQATEADTLEKMIKPLRVNCDIGKKTNPYGISKCWRGYKLHLDVADGFLPISCIFTSASTHDSQAAIPLSKKSSMRAPVLYELMDSAYDVTSIKGFIQEKGRVPLVRMHKRRGKRKEFVEGNERAHKVLNWCPSSETRLKSRFSNERLFARLLDSFLGPAIRVRGIAKVSCHVMLGILSLFASELVRFNL